MRSQTFINCHQLSLQSGDILSTFVNFLCVHGTFRQLSLTFCAATRPSVNFRQLSVQPGDFPTISINFPSGPATFHEIPSTFVRPGQLPSTFVNFPCILETLCQQLSTVREVFRFSMNFSQVSLRPAHLPAIFHASITAFINFSQLFVLLLDLPSIFWVVAETYGHFNQLFVQPGDI